MEYKKLIGIGLAGCLSACSGENRQKSPHREDQTNPPPSLGLLTPYHGEEVVISVDMPQPIRIHLSEPATLEYRVKIPSMLEILDVHADGIYDIKGAKASLKKIEDSKEREFYRAEWNDEDKVNIQTQPLRITLEKPDFDPGNSYQVTVSVWDKQQRNDHLTVLLHIEEMNF